MHNVLTRSSDPQRQSIPIAILNGATIEGKRAECVFGSKFVSLASTTRATPYHRRAEIKSKRNPLKIALQGSAMLRAKDLPAILSHRSLSTQLTEAIIFRSVAVIFLANANSGNNFSNHQKQHSISDGKISESRRKLV